MSKFKIRHITKYTYDQPAIDSANEIMLFPIKDQYQEVVKQLVHITGNPEVYIHKDYYGNEVGSFTYSDAHLQLVIDSELEVITHQRPPATDSEPAEIQWRKLGQLNKQAPFIDFLKQENFSAMTELMELMEKERKEHGSPLQAATHFCDYVYRHFKYIKGVTTVETTLDEIWKLRAGVCQDFAHMLLVMLRHMRIPARYVSGYICPNKNGMRGEGATHAWVEAFIPDNGWVGFDPTNNCLVKDLHVRLAIGRSFIDCSPVRGTYKGGADQVLEVIVSVEYEGGPRLNQQLDPADLGQQGSSTYRNSFQRFREIQQQQQQQ